VDGAGHELLSRTALALDQDGHVGLRDQRHHAEDLTHPRRAADNLFETRVRLGLGQLLGILALECLQVAAPPQHHLVLG
jgi:hypothetical protein